MKILMIVIPVIILLSCNNSNEKKTPPIDSATEKASVKDTIQNISADTASNVYCYITGIEKMHDSTILNADYVDFFNGPNVLEEAKKRHRADTAYDKNGKIQDIFVPDDYFIVNDDKTIRNLYLPGATPITMDSEIAGTRKKMINTYGYFITHYQNSLFLLRVKSNRVESIREVFLP